MFESLTEAISGSAWPYAIVFCLAALDVIFPLLPSETAVITGGVLAASGDLMLTPLLVAAAAGAFLGDNFCYAIGRHGGRRIAPVLFRGTRGQGAIDWAARVLDERGGQLIVVSRYIPAGRTATTFVAGMTGFGWRRFVAFDAVGAVTWALYGALLGYFGGKTFKAAPWKGLLVALALAGTVALAIEAVRWLRRRRAA
jgi:membrane-associated protein